RLIASTSGSLFDTRLSLFSGDSLTNLTAVACDAASLNTPVDAGKTYYLQLGGKSVFSGVAHAGQFQLSVMIGSAPTNDNLEASLPIVVPASLNLDTTFATLQTGEFDACSSRTGKSVWFRFVPSASGSVVFDAAATGFSPS